LPLCSDPKAPDVNTLTTRSAITGVIEIPKGTTPKFEVCLTEELNPIKQDIKTDKETGETVLRYYAYPTDFNYGMIP
jgi:inorganic pyrophosphatase